jgi:hypothetical protein
MHPLGIRNTTKQEFIAMQSIGIFIVSKQTQPNVIGFEHFRKDLDLVVLIESTTGDPQWKSNLLHSINIDKQSERVRCIRIDWSDPRNLYQQFYQLIDELSADYPLHHFLVNLTGGTKVAALVLADCFREEPKAELYYVDTEASKIQFLFSHFDQEEFSSESALDIRKSLRAAGYHITPQNRQEAEKRFELNQQYRIPWLSFVVDHLDDMYPAIAALNKLFFQEKERNKSAYSNTNAVQVELPLQGSEFKQCQSSVVAQCFSIAQECKLVQLRADGSAIIQSKMALGFFGGGWLEELVYQTAKAIGFDDIAMSLNIKSNKSTPNELDCVIVHHNHMLLIECKTGSNIEKDNQAILQKLAQLGDSIGGSFCERWVVSLRTPKPFGQRKSSIFLARAQELGIHVYSEDDIKNLAVLLKSWKDKVSQQAAKTLTTA